MCRGCFARAGCRPAVCPGRSSKSGRDSTRTVRLISEWETSDDFSIGRLHSAANVGLGFSCPTGTISSCHQAHIICQSTSATAGPASHRTVQWYKRRQPPAVEKLARGHGGADAAQPCRWTLRWGKWISCRSTAPRSPCSCRYWHPPQPAPARKPMEQSVVTIRARPAA
jgi:hypothetical protein